MRRGEGLTVEDRPDQEHQGGRDVLEKADARERNPTRGGPEQQERRDRGDAGPGEKERDERTRRAEGADPAAMAEREINERGRCDDHELDHEADDRVQPPGLLDQTVEREAERETQAHPGKAAVVHGEHEHPDRRERDRHDLEAAEALAEHDDAEYDADERVDVVAQARLHETVGVHRPRVDEPVAAHENARPRRDQERPPIANRDGHLARLQRRYENHKEQCRPDNPVGENLGRRYRPEPLPVEGQEPPQEKGEKPRDGADQLLCIPQGWGDVAHRRSVYHTDRAAWCQAV